MQLRALGDFDVSNRTVEIVGATARERALGLPSATRAVAIRPAGGALGFHGVGERRGERADVLLWPDFAECELFRASGPGAYPAARGRQALGVSVSQHTLLVAGGFRDSASALAVDLLTGVATRIEGLGGLLERHEYPTVTEFGDGLVVAGGYDFVEERNASAEVFDPALGRFESTPIGLRNPRRRHAAVVLATGETLLIGGLNGSGRPLPSVEVLSPSARAASSSGLALLLDARVEPSATRLDTGRVLVVSGMTDDGEPGTLTRVPPALEWISADAKANEQKGTLPPRFNRALVARPGGGGLAVGGCEDRAPLAGEACSARCGTLPDELADSLAGRARGCPPASFDVWWIRDDGGVTPLPDLPPGIDASRPALIAASDAAPWLIAGERVLRFDPWTGRFAVAGLPERITLPEDVASPVAIDTGAFAWLSEGIASPSGLPEVTLRSFRHGTRSRFESDTPLLPDGALHLAPNQAPVLPEGSESDVRYDGALHLRGVGAQAFVTDTTYADVELELVLSSGVPPFVTLDDVRVTWSNVPTVEAPRTLTLTLRRRGDVIELTHGADSPRARQTVRALRGARVRLGLAGAGAGDSEISRIEIRRSF